MPYPYAGRQSKFGVAQTLLWGWNISLITHLYTLPFLGLSPTLTGDNMLLRELVAVNQTTCPIQNGSYIQLLPSSSPTATGKTSYAVFSPPSLQSTEQARATRSERRGKEGVCGGSKPGSHCHVEHGEASPTSSVLSDGPGSCRETPLLSPPYPPFPSSLLSRLHLSQCMCHLNLGRPQFHPRDKSWDT